MFIWYCDILWILFIEIFRDIVEIFVWQQEQELSLYKEFLDVLIVNDNDFDWAGDRGRHASLVFEIQRTMKFNITINLVKTLTT